MHKLLVSLTSVSILLVSMLASAAVYADDAHFIVGEKYGSVKFKNSFGGAFDDTHGNGLLLGYNLGSGMAAQLELVRANGDISAVAGGGSYSGKTQALYLAYRSAGDFYFLVKGGYLWEQISMTSGAVSTSTSDKGLAGGLGAGYTFGLLSLEAEYTRIEKNIDFFSVGFNFNF